MLAAKEKKHLDYSSVCRVVVSSNFRKSMESPEGRVGSVGKSDQAKRRTFRGRKTGMLPEMPW